MAMLDTEGLDDPADLFVTEEYDAVCPKCGTVFPMTQEDLLRPAVRCPHCGAEVDWENL